MFGTSWDDPKTMATLNLAAGLLGGGNFGQALGRGLQGYSTTMSNAEESAARKQEREYLNLMRKMQMDELIQKQQKQKRADEWRAQLPGLMAPKLQGTDPVTNQIAAENAEFGDFGVQKLAELRSPLAISYGPDQKALQNHLMSPDSPFADELIKQQLFPKERKLMTVKPGDVVLDERDPTKPVYSVPEKIDPNKPFLNINGQIVPNPAYQEYEFKRAEKTAARVNTTNIVDTTGKAFWGDYGKIQAQNLDEAGKGASQALSTIKMIDDVVPRLSQSFTGPGAEYRQAAVGVLRGLGMDIDEKRFSNTAFVQKQLSELVLGKIKQLGANPSNSDLLFIQNTVPRIGDDPRAMTDMLMFLRDKEMQRISGYNSRIEQVRQNPGAQGIPFGLEPIQAPKFGGFPLPANPTPSNLVKDRVYNTPRGVAKWDGMRFVQVD